MNTASAPVDIDPYRKHKSLLYISKYVGRAIKDYQLIDNGDCILVAVSGGKDSLTLLDILARKRKVLPVKFEIIAVHAVSDFRCQGCIHEETLKQIFEKADVEYHFVPMNIKDKINEKGINCFICSWHRRRILFQTADRLNCPKIALGHHKDDIIETTLMNLFYHGEVSTMPIKLKMFKGKFHLIRPLAYVLEKDTAMYARLSGFPENLCQCPFGANSKRKEIKALISDLEKDCEYVKKNIFNALTRVNEEYILLKPGPKT